MARYNTEYNDEGVICPYCGFSNPSGKAVSVDTAATSQCGDCGKYFDHEQMLVITHVTTPDCELNGDRHIFGKKTDYGAYNSGKRYLYSFCEVCNKCKIEEVENDR